VSERRARFERIRLSGHARKRMRQRNVPRSQIMRTLNEPERAFPGAEEGELVAERPTQAGNVIRVVYTEDPEPDIEAFIITLVRR
jgi:hypothetical protein